MDVTSWLEAYRVAWEEMDADAAAELFTDDSTYREVIFEEPFAGSDGVRAYWANATSTQEDVRVRMGKAFGDGDRAAAEFWTTMRNAGEEVTLCGCLLLRFDDDGRCRSLREYWVVQPGILEPPPEWGT